MNPTVNYNSTNNEFVTARRYTGFPLNSTLVSSYTPDTIRSIINQAASGQPYSTAVWIRISRLGIQVSAQDAQIARTRKPVFIPIALIHDIFMQPTINNVICIVYDEVQSNMKGVLLYVVHPTDAQLIRDDFRLVKQGNSNPQTMPANYSSPFDNRYSTATSLFTAEENRTISERQLSPRRPIYVREEEGGRSRDATLVGPQVRYTPSKSSYQSSKEGRPHRRHNKSPRKDRRNRSPLRAASEQEEKSRRKHRSRSAEKAVNNKLPPTNTDQDLTPEQIQQQQQLQQFYLQQQQQQMAAWQTNQQMPLIPMGIYNRYVPKTIPLPTGETLKTTLPITGANGETTNGFGVAYIEPVQTAPPAREPSSTRPTTTTTKATASPSNEPISNDSDDTKRYLKALVEEMQSLKVEMNKIRQSSVNSTPRGRSDSVQVDLKQLRSDIDNLRSRIAMTTKYSNP